jgi:tetratricopeptide (TPR) repeat protein
LAAKGDLAGALTKYAESSRLGPHFADPLKGWGNVLMKQGKIEEVLAKYNEALQYAPNWKQLKEARTAAVKQKT